MNGWARLSMYLKAVRDGMVWMVPALLLASVLLLISHVIVFTTGSSAGIASMLQQMGDAYHDALPFLLAIAISYMLAIQHRLARPPVMLLVFVYVLLAHTLLDYENQSANAFALLGSILIPVMAVGLLSFFYRRRVGWLAYKPIGSINVEESMNLIVPGIIVGVIILLVVHVAAWALSMLPDFDYTLDPERPYLSGITFASLNSLSWFFGVHGYYALLPMAEQLQAFVTTNQELVASGAEAKNLMNLAHLGAFVFIGGSGATLSLIVAILLISKNSKYRLIAIAALPIAAFNVNEILLFGIPLILNPRFFIPFLVTPMVNVVVSLWLVEAGLIGISYVGAPFLSPVILNAYLVAGGDASAVLAQILLVLLGCLIYMPFLRAEEKHYDESAIRLRSLDTTYSRRMEEVAAYVDDPIADAVKERARQDKIYESLRKLSDHEFFLEYQPQYCRSTNKIVGCEALIRVVDEDGHTLRPAEFLGWLGDGGKMPDVDYWVVQKVIAQIRAWKDKGIDIPVSINLTTQSLYNEDVLRRIVHEISLCGYQLGIEVTEEGLLSNIPAAEAAIAMLKGVNARIYLDDFGTGYSSLSYLGHFDVDAIKIDRGFLMELETSKGRSVFETMFVLAEKLELDVVVEGVETLEQFRQVPENDNVSLQGWYHSKSLQPEELERVYLGNF